MNEESRRSKIVTAGREEQCRMSSRRRMLLAGTALAGLSTVGLGTPVEQAQAQQTPPPAAGGRKPNILAIFGDDIGQSNISAYTFGLMGYRTPNIDRLAKEGMMFSDYYAGRFFLRAGARLKAHVCLRKR